MRNLQKRKGTRYIFIFCKANSLNSATIKLRDAHRQQMLIDNAHVEDIIKILHCGRPSCPNHNNWCYELDGIHLKVMPPHMKIWSMSINDGKAALDVPPDGLVVTLLPSKSGTHNPLRSENAVNTAKPSTKLKFQSSPEVTSSVPAYLAPPMHPAFPQYPGFPQYYYSPYASSAAHHPSLPPALAPSHLQYVAQFSNSFEEQDPLEQLIAYFAFLVAKSPMQSAALNIAKDMLMEEGHTFKTLEKLSQADLKKAGIKPGMAMQLKSYIDLFKRKTLNHA